MICGEGHGEAADKYSRALHCHVSTSASANSFSQTQRNLEVNPRLDTNYSF
jgi:hypothetical protein